MTVVERIRLAYRGNKEERMFLVQDRNRLVSSAALKSPKTRDADAETIANMKSVSEDVLRAIAFRRDWMRHYGIMRALVRNPRSPIDVTLGLVDALNAKDLKTSRGRPERARSRPATARREVARKEVTPLTLVGISAPRCENRLVPSSTGSMRAGRPRGIC